MRWTGREWGGDRSYGWYDWRGLVTFNNPDGITSLDAVAWDGHEGYEPVIREFYGRDIITFCGPSSPKAGPHWDGFDFELKGFSGNDLFFTLYSDYLNSGNDGIYMGQDMVPVQDYCDNLHGFKSGNSTIRRFGVSAPVPEPCTLALLGFGLLSFLGIRKRKKD